MTNREYNIIGDALWHKYCDMKRDIIRHKRMRDLELKLKINTNFTTKSIRCEIDDAREVKKLWWDIIKRKI